MIAARFAIAGMPTIVLQVAAVLITPCQARLRPAFEIVLTAQMAEGSLAFGALLFAFFL